MEREWLTKTEDINDAEIDVLKHSILTADGMGVRFKELVLDELLSRVKAGCIKEVID